jgi:RimJ/RimL family protein N-acetyltransferase
MIKRTQGDGFGPLAIEELATSEVIGWCGIQPLRGTEKHEVLYALKPSRWGHGFATESAAALIGKVAAIEDPRIDEIYGVVFPQNLRSIKVLQKLGMRFVEYRIDETARRYDSIYVLRRHDFPTALALGDRYYSTKK